MVTLMSILVTIMLPIITYITHMIFHFIEKYDIDKCFYSICDIDKYIINKYDIDEIL